MIISIVNQKGGTGKTTTAINLATYLAFLGKDVLLIDLDPQANTTSGFGFRPSELNKNIYRVLTKQININEAIIPTKQQKLKLIPSTPDLSGANVELINLERREYYLADLLVEVDKLYDFIIIDCPPSLGLLTICGLVAAEQLLIPVQTEYYALEGLGQLLTTINLIKQDIKPDLKVLGSILTMYDRRSKLSREVWQELYQNFPYYVFRTIIPRSVRLAEAPSFGQSILEYAPKSSGARAYQRLSKEVLFITNN
ncbi:MAG: ParA family protein [Candidatus Aenigmarchaeota archaeon]|nr:ParA family protein [Candidatus Aenigmarchaeota archaeon]